MTPAEWNFALRPGVSNRQVADIVAPIARAYLEHDVRLDDMVSTTTLIDALYPLAYAKQSDEGMAARNRIAHALTKRSLGSYALADCMTVSKFPIKGKFGMGYPCLWHAPKSQAVCASCGRVLPA